LVPEVEGSQIGAICAGAVSIKVTVPLILEKEEKYSGILLGFKGKTPIYSTAFINTHGSSFIRSKPDGAHHVTSSDFTLWILLNPKCVFVFGNDSVQAQAGTYPKAVSDSVDK
jgi:hypothetical protein